MYSLSFLDSLSLFLAPKSEFDGKHIDCKGNFGFGGGCLPVFVKYLENVVENLTGYDALDPETLSISFHFVFH